MSAHTNSQVSPPLLPGTRAGGARSSAASASARLRLRVYLTRGRLDRMIAAGERPVDGADLALRAEQLTDSQNQQRIARDLRRVMDYAEEHRSGVVASSVMIDAAVVRRGRWALAELAEQLERAGTVDPRGVALAQQLLSDGLSPLFNRHADRTIARAARDIREALEGRPVVPIRAT